jgi:hypothetical protein
MKKQISIILVFVLSFARSFSQSTDPCILWKGRSADTPAGKFDTIKIIGKYGGILENIYHDSYSKSEKQNSFYQNLEKRFKGLTVSLEFDIVGCNKGYYFPLVNKDKYKYTLYHRKDQNGKFHDWKEGTLIELTIVRYNQYFYNSNNLITIITDVKRKE